MSHPVGWRNEPARHALAAKGIETQPVKRTPSRPVYGGHGQSEVNDKMLKTIDNSAVSREMRQDAANLVGDIRRFLQENVGVEGGHVVRKNEDAYPTSIQALAELEWWLIELADMNWDEADRGYQSEKNERVELRARQAGEWPPKNP